MSGLEKILTKINLQKLFSESSSLLFTSGHISLYSTIIIKKKKIQFIQGGIYWDFYGVFTTTYLLIITSHDLCQNLTYNYIISMFVILMNKIFISFYFKNCRMRLLTTSG